MRVLHCPSNISGELWEYAQGLRSLNIDSTVLTFSSHPFGYPSNINLNYLKELNFWKRKWKLSQGFLFLLKNYDIFHFHFGKTLLKKNLDLPLLRLMNKKVLMNYWGSEVRLRTIAKQKNPYYDLIGHPSISDELKIRNLEKISRYIKTAAVADYELYSYVSPFFDRTVILPQAINTQEVHPPTIKYENTVPIVVHAPSKKNIKGTLYIERAVRNLKKRFKFKFILLYQMKNQEVKRILERADIVVDQLLIGTYGIFSLEAMAMGKPVLCYIREDLIEKYPKDISIVNANPDTIEIQLEQLLASPNLRDKIGKQSRKFVEKYHDSLLVAQKLVEIYKTL